MREGEEMAGSGRQRELEAVLPNMTPQVAGAVTR